MDGLFATILNSIMYWLQNFLPSITLAIIIVIVGYIIGKYSGKAVESFVKMIRANESFRTSEIGGYLTSAGYPLSRILGILTKVTIYTLSILAALSIPNIPAIQAINVIIAAYIPRLVGSVIIFLLGAMLIEWLMNIVGHLIVTSKFPKRVTDFFFLSFKYMLYLILIFISFEVAEIAPQVVTAAAQAILLAVAVGIALTASLIVGLGLKDEAVTLVSEEIESLKPGMKINIDGKVGVVKRMTMFLVEIERENGILELIPKRLFIKKGFQILSQEETTTSSS